MAVTPINLGRTISKIPVKIYFQGSGVPKIGLVLRTYEIIRIVRGDEKFVASVLKEIRGEMRQRTIMGIIGKKKKKP